MKLVNATINICHDAAVPENENLKFLGLSVSEYLNEFFTLPEI